MFRPFEVLHLFDEGNWSHTAIGRGCALVRAQRSAGRLVEELQEAVELQYRPSITTDLRTLCLGAGASAGRLAESFGEYADLFISRNGRVRRRRVRRSDEQGRKIEFEIRRLCTGELKEKLEKIEDELQRIHPDLGKALKNGHEIDKLTKKLEVLKGNLADLRAYIRGLERGLKKQAQRSEHTERQETLKARKTDLEVVKDELEGTRTELRLARSKLGIQLEGEDPWLESAAVKAFEVNKTFDKLNGLFDFCENDPESFASDEAFVTTRDIARHVRTLAWFHDPESTGDKKAVAGEVTELFHRVARLPWTLHAQRQSERIYADFHTKKRRTSSYFEFLADYEAKYAGSGFLSVAYARTRLDESGEPVEADWDNALIAHQFLYPYFESRHKVTDQNRRDWEDVGAFFLKILDKRIAEDGTNELEQKWTKLLRCRLIANFVAALWNGYYLPGSDPDEMKGFLARVKEQGWDDNWEEFASLLPNAPQPLFNELAFLSQTNAFLSDSERDVSRYGTIWERLIDLLVSRTAVSRRVVGSIEKYRASLMTYVNEDADFADFRRWANSDGRERFTESKGKSRVDFVKHFTIKWEHQKKEKG